MGGLVIRFWRNTLTMCTSILVVACSHPLVIEGEGDILSGSGMRNCYLENFLAGDKSCTVNLVVGDYEETYYAQARDGWKFVSWKNYCTDGLTADQCKFQFDAAAVRHFWGQTVAPLVAVFEKDTLVPKPVAMYSYAIDVDGSLIDSLPLEGAQLERKTAYFSFTGDYERVSFWCCKVVDGAEAHGEKVDDGVAPFVLRVDLGALPDDAGLTRELYADLFTSATDYSGHTAYWTLESPSQADVVFDDGGFHNIDYTIPGRVIIENNTTVNVLDGAKLLSGVDMGLWGGSILSVFGGEIDGAINNNYGQAYIYGGKSAFISQVGTGETTVFGGTVESIAVIGGWPMAEGSISIEGGSVGSLGVDLSVLTVSGGSVGYIFIETSSVKISGGTFIRGIRFNYLECEVTGGEFLGLFDGGVFSDGGCSIRGGQFSGGFAYYGYYDGNPPTFTFYGDLVETEPVLNGTVYESYISGTLADGSALSQKISCSTAYAACKGLKIISD